MWIITGRSVTEQHEVISGSILKKKLGIQLKEADYDKDSSSNWLWLALSHYMFSFHLKSAWRTAPAYFSSPYVFIAIILSGQELSFLRFLSSGWLCWVTWESGSLRKKYFVQPWQSFTADWGGEGGPLLIQTQSPLPKARLDIWLSLGRLKN